MRLADIPLILPAAGKSSRLGSPKGLMLVGGRSWLNAQCEAFRHAGGRIVLVVLGYDRDAYLNALQVTPGTSPPHVNLHDCEVHLLNNDLPEFGPFTSLQTACHWLTSTSECPAAWFLPIDIPLPSPSVLNRLTESLIPGIQVVEPRYGGKHGHPVLLRRDFLQNIMTLDPRDPQSRLDRQIHAARLANKVAEIPVDDIRVTLNLNISTEWENYLNAFPAGTPVSLG